jgi:predicted dienelactone hydrolase
MPIRPALAFLLTLNAAHAAQTQAVSLPGVAPGRELTVRVTMPEKAGRALPVVIFSHGNYCDAARYAVLLEPIADAGYAVLSPEHPDRAPTPEPAQRLSGAVTWPTRLAEMRAVADRLEEIHKQLPADAPRFDGTRIVAAGHSYGGAVAQALGGGRMFARDGTRDRAEARDARFKAVLAWSPPGPIENFIDGETAAGIETPMLVITGTKDFSTMWPDWRLHAVTFDTAKPGDKALLVVDGLDHYLGGLACAEKPTPPQRAEAAIVAQAMIAFLDAHVKNDADARALMRCERPTPWRNSQLTCK